MKYQSNFFGLPNLALNVLSISGGIFLILSGIRVMQSSDVSLRIANSQLITSTSADRLSKLAEELDTQAELIKQKDIAYQQLSEIYQQSLKGQSGYGRLQNAIETVGELPEVGELDTIQTEITTTQEVLGEITPE
jgi:gas vesicle protein